MKYIAYGSNMNLGQMSWRCPNSKVVGIGYIRGWKLYFNIHADIVCTGNDIDITPVLVWDIADEDWHNLDLYEGYPNYYITEQIETNIYDENTDTWHTETCVAYVMTETETDYIAPSEDYVETIAVGYFENGIELDYLYDALNYSTQKHIEGYLYMYHKGWVTGTPRKKR